MFNALLFILCYLTSICADKLLKIKYNFLKKVSEKYSEKLRSCLRVNIYTQEKLYQKSVFIINIYLGEGHQFTEE